MKKSTKILIGLLVLFAAVYAVERLTYTSSTIENSNPFSKIDTSKVSRIAISFPPGGKEIVIEKESRGWFIVNPLRFPADESEINLLLSSVGSNPKASVVADNLSDSLSYGLNSAAPTLRISENIQKEISLRIGDATPDFDGCYVELVGNNKILNLSRNIRTYAAEALTDWRDKRIFDFRFADISAADFAFGDTLVHFLHRDTIWQINGNNIPVQRVHDVIGDFIGTRAMNFVDSSYSGAKSVVDYGFSLVNGGRVAGRVMRLADQTLVSNSSNGQTYVIGSLTSDNLERGLKGISKDYLNKRQ